ncbi:MAG: type II secretion system F family protein [Bdellovibrionia bacterium]
MNAIERGQFVIFMSYALIGLAAFILARMLLEEQESRAAQENLDELRDRKSSNELVKLLRPIFTQYVVPVIRGKPFWDEKRKIFRRKIIAAGLKEELTADEFIAFKIVLILFFPIVGGVLNAAEMIDVPWYYVLGFGVVGWFYPNIWTNSRIESRQKQVLRAMPFIVDLLALSTEAGLDFLGAIGKVVEKARPSPLVEEFAQLLKEIKVGASRQDALREMAARIDMTAVNSFVAILISADQMGASIGKILRQQSDQIRSERMLRAEKAGAAAAQKVLLPVALFILPAVILMIMGPFGLSFIYPPAQ